MGETEVTLKKLWGLLEYKPQWSLTLKAWLLLSGIAIFSFVFILTHVRDFLAPEKPIGADVLLIEGWVGDPVLRGGALEFRNGDYKFIITTGTPIYKGSFFTEFTNYADAARASLIKLGVEPDKIIAVSVPEVVRDRTATMAKAVRERLQGFSEPVRGINIYSFDVHTRRSYLIYKRVLAPKIPVGAIAYPNSSYNPRRWWTSSVGFRSVIEEAIAYIYARFLWRLS